MSDGGRGRAPLGVFAWKSSQKWSAQRSAVRSIAWLGGWGEFMCDVLNRFSDNEALEPDGRTDVPSSVTVRLELRLIASAVVAVPVRHATTSRRPMQDVLPVLVENLRKGHLVDAENDGTAAVNEVINLDPIKADVRLLGGSGRIIIDEMQNDLGTKLSDLVTAEMEIMVTHAYRLTRTRSATATETEITS